MGSKKLKAIAVCGSQKVPVYDAELCNKLSKNQYREIYDTAKQGGLRQHGTPDLCVTAERFGDMPIKNWSGEVWPEGAAKLGGPNYTQVLDAKPQACIHCPIGCHRQISVDENDFSIKGPGPEYETLGMLGSNLLIDDLCAIARANEICNKLGMDTITAGACIGLAMECYEKGYLTNSQTGLNLAWGNAESMIELLLQIGYKTKFGAIFADGALQGARRLHSDAPSLVAHVKGLELPAHDARSFWSLGVTYATGTRGACHMRGVTEDVEMGGIYIPELGIVEGWSDFYKEENKSLLTVKLQDLCSWLNSLVICVFMLDGGGLSISNLLEIFNSVTGWGWDVNDIMECGERIINLQRLVNIRDGHSRATDTLPPKMFKLAKKGFRAEAPAIPINKLLDEYYQIREWDSNGYPTQDCLDRLGLGDYVEIVR